MVCCCLQAEIYFDSQDFKEGNCSTEEFKPAKKPAYKSYNKSVFKSAFQVRSSSQKSGLQIKPLQLSISCRPFKVSLSSRPFKSALQVNLSSQPFKSTSSQLPVNFQSTSGQLPVNFQSTSSQTFIAQSRLTNQAFVSQPYMLAFQFGLSRSLSSQLLKSASQVSLSSQPLKSINFKSISSQFQVNFKSISSHFQVNFKLISNQFQVNFKAISCLATWSTTKFNFSLVKQKISANNSDKTDIGKCGQNEVEPYALACPACCRWYLSSRCFW